jgi:tetratricopeptide (TPR) repeat protein
MTRSEAVYERYKDALRRGHVAALRGRLDEALEAYAEAAGVAPDRALPLSSAAAALARRGRHAEALAGYEAALLRAPRDETALAGRAEALASLGRRRDAAEAFDVVAETRQRAGRIREACDAARRALELGEARHRRQLLEVLIERLRTSQLDAPARRSLERALVVLEAQSTPGDAASTATVKRRTADAADATGAAGPHPATETQPATGSPAESASIAELTARADAAVDAGDAAAAREQLVLLARAHERAGRIDAALDACYGALASAPDDGDLHLLLVDLYRDRGWDVLADEKLALLGRLAVLDKEQPTAG